MELRINDMQELLTELRSEASYLKYGTPEYKKIVSRYKDIEVAIVWWLELRYEGDIVHEN